jgi:sulfoxide reductase heme-binding subunit YedZ
MTTHDNLAKKSPQNESLVGGLLVAALLFETIVLVASILATQTGVSQAISSMFVLDSVHLWWYLSRAAGLMGYLLIWLSTMWGFAIGSKIFDSLLERFFTFDFHEHLSWLGLGFIGFHAIALLFDRVEPLSLTEVLLPFASSYHPFWTGIGILGFYLTLLVTVTFYLHSKISMKTFRSIHYLNIAAYVGALFHGLYAGTDSALPWVQIMYWGTFLSTVFFLVFWLATRSLNPRKSARRLQA